MASPAPRMFGTDATNRTPEAQLSASKVGSKASPADVALGSPVALADEFLTPPMALPTASRRGLGPQMGVDIAAASPATARATLQEMNHALIARMEKKKATQKQANKRLKALERERSLLQQQLRSSHDCFSFQQDKENNVGGIAQSVSGHSLEQLQIELAEKEAQIGALGELVGGLQAQLAHAQSELERVNETAAALRGFEAKAMESAERTRQLTEELALAESQGTPRGEGAKVVLKMSFQKIAALQQRLVEEQARAGQAEDKMSELEGDAQKLWETVMLNSQLEGELRAKEEAINELSSKQVATEGEKVVAEELARSLEGRVLDQTRLLQRVNQEKEAALSEIATLREQMQDALSDARAAANRGTPRGEGAKKVLRMAFARIRDLNQRIDSIDKEVKHADERAETVQLAATSAMSELRESNAELTRKYRQLEQSLEKSESEHCAEVQRLSSIAQRDATARDADAETLSSALREQQQRVASLEAREASLRDELTSLEAENLEIRALLIEHQELSELAGEMGARYAGQISELCRQLGEKDSEVMEARMTGTPGGEGAKVVRDLALAKLRTREAQLKVLEAVLTETEAKLEGAEAALRKERAESVETEGTVARVSQQLAEVAAGRDAAVQELEDARQAVALEQAAVGVATDLLRSYVAELEAKLEVATVGRQTAESQCEMISGDSAMLLNDLVEASAAAARLQEELSKKEEEIARAKAEGTPIGEGAKVVRDMALERIREREAALTDIRAKLEGANVAERSARQALEESEVKRAAVDAEVTELRAALAASDQDKLSLNASLLESREEVSRLNDRLQLSSEEVAELAGEVERLQAKVDDGARRVSEMSGIAAAQMAAVRASEEHRSDAVTQLRVSLDLMAAETEELEQDCRQLAEQRADAVSAADAWRNRCLSLQETVGSLESMVKDMSTISLHFAVSGEATVVEDGHARVGNDVTDVDWVAEKKPEPGFTGKTPNPVARLSPASAAHHEAGSHPQPTSYSSFLDFEALEAQVGRLLAEVTAADEDAQRCQDLARSAAADAAEAKEEGVRRRQETERLQKIVAATQQALAAREGLITVHEKLCEEQKRQLESAGRLAEEKSSLAEKHIALSTQQADQLQKVSNAANKLLSTAAECQTAEAERAQVASLLNEAHRELAVRVATASPVAQRVAITTSRHSQTSPQLRRTPAPGVSSSYSSSLSRRQLAELLITSALATLVSQLYGC